MTKTNALTHTQAKNLGPGKYTDGRGLTLVKTSKVTGYWVLRVCINKKRREMGLGGWPEVPIAEARKSAAHIRQKVRQGIDPIKERRQQTLRKNNMTVAEAIESCFKSRQAQLKNDGVAGGWMSPLNVHVIPKIGNDPIEDVDQHLLRKLLSPIWHKKPEVALKSLNRINLTLKHAAALDLDVDLQAVMKARELLGKQRRKKKHIPSLPYQEIPQFYQWICKSDLVSNFALRFLIISLARTSEVRFAFLSEISNDVWNIPAEHSKTNEGRTIPLTPEAINILSKTTAKKPGDILFPNTKGKPLSDAAMSRFMERNGYEARPHGFRATFRTWCEECTEAPHAVKEMCLGHKVGSEVERAYQRSDLIDKRRKLMQQWEDHLLSSN